MEKSFIKKLMRNIGMCFASGVMLAACGGGDTQGSANTAVKLLANGEVCNAAWVSATVYVAGNKVSYNGVNYTAAYWTQGNNPSTSNGPVGSGQPWIAGFTCGSGTTTTSTSTTKIATTSSEGTTTTTTERTTTSTTLAISVCKRTVNVNSDATLASATANAVASDCIVVADGSYSGFTMTKSGTATAPISIKAAHQGKANVTSGKILLNGASYVTLEGFLITTSSSPLMADGNKLNVGVAILNASNSRVTRSTFRLTSPPANTNWLYIGGHSDTNRVDHNEFGPFLGTGKQVFVQPGGNAVIPGVTPPANRSDWIFNGTPDNPNIARRTQIDHNYFHDKAPATSETINLGCCGVTGNYQVTQSIVEFNLFQNCDGNAELLSVNSSSNHIRYNTVLSSVGAISLRNGINNVVYGNFMLQAGKGGGIVVNERNHLIYNNYIEGTADYAMLLEGGDPYDGSGGPYSHGQVVDVQIVNNTVVNPGKNILFGHGGTLHPTNVLFANNILTGAGTLLSDNGSVNTTFSKNISWPFNPNKSGFSVVNPQLVRQNGVMKLSATSPAINAADAVLGWFVKDDEDGEYRSIPDIGADEFYVAPNGNRHVLSISDVGPNSL